MGTNFNYSHNFRHAIDLCRGCQYCQEISTTNWFKVGEKVESRYQNRWYEATIVAQLPGDRYMLRFPCGRDFEKSFCDIRRFGTCARRTGSMIICDMITGYSKDYKSHKSYKTEA